jgi:hypothetical protein
MLAARRRQHGQTVIRKTVPVDYDPQRSSQPTRQTFHESLFPLRGAISMSNRNLVRGLFLMGIALLFGLSSFKYNMGQLSRSGPGLFPFMVSSLLFILGLITVVRARFLDPVPLGYNVKNIALVLTSLVGFALLSEHVNMIVGIVFMVFCSSYAATSQSLARSVKVSIGLTLVAFGFKYLLGLNLPLV